MKGKELYFTHRADSPLLAPVSSYIRELGVRKTGKVTSPESLNHVMHRHDGIEICYVIKEIHKWQFGDQQLEVYPGETFITCPWQEHGCINGTLDRGFIAWLIIKPELFTPDGRLILGDWSNLNAEDQQIIGKLLVENKTPVIPQDETFVNRYREINKELINKDICYLERTNLLLDSMLIHVARSLKNNKGAEKKDGDFVVSIKERMKEAIKQKTNVNDLAYSFGMSPSSFNNKVKALTGSSPADYLLSLRIKRAKELLENTDDPIISIASDCGFCTPQYFATQFAKRVGLTPSGYRARLEKKINA